MKTVFYFIVCILLAEAFAVQTISQTGSTKDHGKTEAAIRSVLEAQGGGLESRRHRRIHGRL